MPLYEYQCLDCQDTFQERRPFSESHVLSACPSCESERTRKSIGTIMVLSGSESLGIPAGDAPAMGGCCGGHCGCQH